MMGVTLFLENDEKARHSEETVIITKKIWNLKKNLQMISSSDSKRIPLKEKQLTHHYPAINKK